VVATGTLLSRHFASEPHSAVANISSSLTNTGLRAGPGGRASISGVTATVFGATGFLGRYIVSALAEQGSQVVCPYRCDDLDMQHLRVMGDLGTMVHLPDFSARDDEFIRHAVSQSNVVINLIGSERETPRFKFQEVHVDIAQRIAQAAADSGVCERLIHTSCLGATLDAPSRRLQTKAEGDAKVLEAFPAATILKPAYMTGVEDRFLNMYTRLLMNMPFLPLVGGGDAKVQPVYVRDVAQAFMEVLKTKDSKGKTYNLAGPKTFTRREIVDLMYHTVRENNRAFFLPEPIALLLAKPREFLLKRGVAIPSLTMYSEDAIREQVADIILDPSDGLLTFSDLGMTPQRIDIGIPLEHVRYYRVGGYDVGTTSGTEEEVQGRGTPATY